VIPEKLAWHRTTPLGAAWLERLPRLVEECAEQWQLDLEPAFTNGMVAYCAPAGDVVLKVNYPDHESEHEPDALAHWDGDGAVRLLARDDERRALLIERCRPGTPLWDLPEDAAIDVAVQLFRRLWKSPPPEHPFRLLADDAERWGCDELGRSQGDPVVLHQDLQGSNVLLSERGWLAIDAKPLVGEREFDLASLIRDRRFTFDPALLRRRLDVLTEALGLNRERARRWAIVHARAWSLGDPLMEACARALEEA
jgi:streptomycin 6-kinase